QNVRKILVTPTRSHKRTGRTKSPGTNRKNTEKRRIPMSRMTTTSPDVQIGGEISSMKIQKEIFIEAPIDIAFECVLAQLGPESEMPDGKPFPFKIEAWPGGRWFRDLGNNTGHLWGHVQVIKPPKLIELSGPFMMSYAATNHIQY